MMASSSRDGPASVAEDGLLPVTPPSTSDFRVLGRNADFYAARLKGLSRLSFRGLTMSTRQKKTHHWKNLVFQGGGVKGVRCRILLSFSSTSNSTLSLEFFHRSIDRSIDLFNVLR
jgi:hypothetical protein